MSKIQGFKRLQKEGLPEDYHELIDIIGPSINTFADEVTSAFNKGLSIDDNLRMDYKEIEITPNTSGEPKNTTQFKIPFSGKLRGIIVIKVDKVTSNTTGTFSAISATSPTVITTLSDNKLVAGQTIKISGSDSTPSIDGIWAVTPITTTTFQIPIAVTIAGTKGSFELLSYPLSTPFISFSQNNNLITIKHITGLQADNKYRLTILSLG